MVFSPVLLSNARASRIDAKGKVLPGLVLNGDAGCGIAGGAEDRLMKALSPGLMAEAVIFMRRCPAAAFSGCGVSSSLMPLGGDANGVHGNFFSKVASILYFYK